MRLICGCRLCRSRLLRHRHRWDFYSVPNCPPTQPLTEHSASFPFLPFSLSSSKPPNDPTSQTRTQQYVRTLSHRPTLSTVSLAMHIGTFDPQHASENSRLTGDCFSSWRRWIVSLSCISQEGWAATSDLSTPPWPSPAEPSASPLSPNSPNRATRSDLLCAVTQCNRPLHASSCCLSISEHVDSQSLGLRHTCLIR